MRRPESVSGVRRSASFEIHVSAANMVKHTVSSDIVTANEVRIPIFAR